MLPCQFETYPQNLNRLREGAGEAAAAGAPFAVGAIVLMPILYGVMGFVGGLIMAGLDNLVARLTGGIELELS